MKCCERLGAGEILLNCVDMDGQKDGFDLGLVKVIVYCNVHTSIMQYDTQCGMMLPVARSTCWRKACVYLRVLGKHVTFCPCDVP